MDAQHASASSNPWGLEPLLDVAELAEYLGVPVSTVYDWRTHGKGPRGYRFGKRVKFAVSGVQAWMEQQRDPEPPHTSDVGGPILEIQHLGQRLAKEANVLGHKYTNHSTSYRRSPA